MSAGWTEAGKKKSTKSRSQKKREHAEKLAAAASKSAAEPAEMDPADWDDKFSELDKQIYALFKGCHPIPLSPETILLQLEGNVTKTQVWKSLDVSPLCKYVKQLNKFDWRLVTVED